MDTRGICAIIRTCKEAGVTYFRLHHLEFYFGELRQTTAEPANTSPNQGEAQPDNSLTRNSQTTEIPVHDEVALRQEQLDFALVENPALYEELATSGDMTDAEDVQGSGQDLS